MAIEYAGGVNRNDLYTAVTTRPAACAHINTTLVAAGWSSEALKPFTVFTMIGNAVNNETVTLAGKVYTWKTAINNANDGEILIGIDSTTSITNFKACVNLEAGAGTLYSSATTANTFLEVAAPSNAIQSFPFTVPGSVSCVVQQIVSGISLGYTVSETMSQGSFVTLTVNWAGFKCTSALTPQGLQCKFIFFDAQGSNTQISCVATNSLETSISNSFAAAEIMLGSVSVDIRVIANRYHMMFMPDGTPGNAPGTFWFIGTPWIPPALEGWVVTDASNTTPIVITTSAAHGYSTSDIVTVRGVLGNLSANATGNLITVTGPTTFELDGTVGSGAYTSGGRVANVNYQIAECIISQGAGDSGNWLRQRLAQGGNNWQALNGSTVKNGSGIGCFNIVAPLQTNNNAAITELMWFNRKFLVTEPLIAMGTSALGTAYVVGQLFDMVVVRKTLTADITGSFDSHNWWNLTFTNLGGASGNILASILHVVP